jgi:hypothetical protein
VDMQGKLVGLIWKVEVGYTRVSRGEYGRISYLAKSHKIFPSKIVGD